MGKVVRVMARWTVATTGHDLSLATIGGGALAVCLATSAVAAEAGGTIDPYVGLDVGYGAVFGSYHQRGTRFTNTEDEEAGMHGVEGGAHVGLTYRGAGWSLGLEAGYTRSAAQAKLDDPNNVVGGGTVSAKATDSFSLDLKPAVDIGADIALYGRIGAARTNVEISADGRSWLAMPRGRIDRYINGLRLGIGVEQWFGPRLSLDTGLVYTRYEDIAIDDLRSFDLSGAQARIGLSYHLNERRSRSPSEQQHNLRSQLDGAAYVGALGRYSVASIDADYVKQGDQADIEGIGIHGASAAVLGGYGVNLSGFYVGGEMAYRKWGPSFAGDGGWGGNSAKVQFDDTIMGGIRLGFYPSPAHLLYARASVVSAEVSVKGASATHSWTLDQSERIFGGNVALGYEVPIAGQLVGRFETDYTRYRPLNISFDDDHIDNVAISEFGVALGISYYF